MKKGNFISYRFLKNDVTPFIVAYLVKGQHDVNLIGINWEKGSDTINYPKARKHVGAVGQHVAQFIDFMVNKISNARSLIKINQ